MMENMDFHDNKRFRLSDNDHNNLIWYVYFNIG